MSSFFVSFWKALTRTHYSRAAFRRWHGGRVGRPEPARLFGLKTALHRPLVSRAGDGGHPLRLEHTSVRCARKSFACFAGARLNANDPAGQERVSEKSLHAYSAVLDACKSRGKDGFCAHWVRAPRGTSSHGKSEILSQRKIERPK